MPGEFFDVVNEPPLESGGKNAAGSGSRPNRPFIGIHFACCGVYSRIFPNRDRSAYVGNCPRCLRRIELKISPHGSDQRLFVAQ